MATVARPQARRQTWGHRGVTRVDYVFQWDFIWQSRGELLRGALLTLRLSAETMLFGLLLGVLGAWAKTSRRAALRGGGASAISS